MKIKITDENNEGLGVGRIDNKVTFVPFSIKGEELDVNIIKENKKYNEAIFKNIIKVSKYRKMPNCKYYFKCGGCNLMHMKYNYQLDYKKRKVINNFKHISNIDIDNIDIIFDNDFNYRNHVTFSVKDKKIGFLKNNSNEVIDIDKCLISNEKINKCLKEIRLFLDKYDVNIDKISIKAYDEILIDICSNDFLLVKEFKNYVNFDSLFLNGNYVSGKKEILINFNNYKYKVSAKSFFQKNTNMAIKLYDYIKSNIKENTNILDLYCGVGSIGIYISDKVKKVIGIEVIKEGIDNALENAILNDVHNIEFICGKVEDNIDNIKKIDTIIVDPPRVGLNKKTINNIIKINSKNIIYVSCNSTSLARDLNILKEYYNIKEIKLFDLFPNTYHCESITVLERR